MSQKKNSLVVIIVVVAVVAGIAIWYSQRGKSSPQAVSQPVSGSVSPSVTPSVAPAQPAATPQIDQKAADISLGSQILQKTQNPAKDKLPETNPFQNAYTNPF